MCSHIFLNAGMEMDSMLDSVIDSSHRSFFAAVEHRAPEVLRPRPPGEQISIHHDWGDDSYAAGRGQPPRPPYRRGGCRSACGGVLGVILAYN